MNDEKLQFNSDYCHNKSYWAYNTTTCASRRLHDAIRNLTNELEKQLPKLREIGRRL